MTDTFVVDAGVFLRWFVSQVGYEHAREVRTAFLAGDVRLETLDSVRIEYAHVLRTKGVLPGHLDKEDYVGTVRLLDDLGVVVHPTDVDAVESAAELALAHHIRFFDALVADRALRSGLPLLTSDKKLSHAVNGAVRVEVLRGV